MSKTCVQCGHSMRYRSRTCISRELVKTLTVCWYLDSEADIEIEVLPMCTTKPAKSQMHPGFDTSKLHTSNSIAAAS